MIVIIQTNWLLLKMSKIGSLERMDNLLSQESLLFRQVKSVHLLRTIFPCSGAPDFFALFTLWSPVNHSLHTHDTWEGNLRVNSASWCVGNGKPITCTEQQLNGSFNKVIDK